jgi:hypothetical protein
MPQVFNDNTGNRVIVRHKGPAGKGIPVGGTTGQILVKDSATDYDTHWANPPDGTDAVVGPASATDGNIALFDGTTGKLIKNSTVSPASFASAASLSGKVNVVSGKGLSEEDFTTAEKTKLGNLSQATFRGTFANYSAITSFSFDPVPISGDYCVVEATGVTNVIYFWDDTNNVWTPQTQEPVAMTGEEIALALFDSDDSGAWDIDECRIYTQTEKAQVAAHEAIINSLGLGSVVLAYGALSYFSITGDGASVVSTSDGLTNMVKLDPPTALGGVVSGFDNGGASNGRLRYTGTTTKNFAVTARVSLSAANADTLVFGLAKNATIDQPSRVLVTPAATGEIVTVTLTSFVSLATNDYLELFVGNLDATNSPTIHVLAIEACTI